MTGSSISLVLGRPPRPSVSNRLRLLPQKLIPHPLAINNVTFEASPAGDTGRRAVPCCRRHHHTQLFSSLPASASTSRIVERREGPHRRPGPRTRAVGALGAAAEPMGSGTEVVPGGVVGVDIAGLIGSWRSPRSSWSPRSLADPHAGDRPCPDRPRQTLMGAYLGQAGAGHRMRSPWAGRDGLHTLGIMLLAAVVPPGPRRGPGAARHGRCDRVRLTVLGDWRLAAAWPGACTGNRRAGPGCPGPWPLA